MLRYADWVEMYRHYFNGRCAYCNRMIGLRADAKERTKDHIIPVSRGGLHATTNIAPACRACNAKKGAMTPLEWLMAHGRD